MFGGLSGSSRWKRTLEREGGGGGGSSGPGTPLSAASESDDGGCALSEQRRRPRLCPLPPLSLPLPTVTADPAAEAKMAALRARLGCSSPSDGGGGGDEGGRTSAPAPPSSSAAPSSAPARLGDRARSSAELASLSAKETSELTMGDLRLLLAAVRRAGEEARRRRRTGWGRQQRDEGGDGGGSGDGGDTENEIDLFCSVEPPEALRLGRAQALQQAAAAVLRLL